MVNEDRATPPKPEPLDDGDDVSAEEKAVWDAEYIDDKGRAATILVESIADDQIDVIDACATDPVLIWSTIQKSFARKSRSEKTAASREFHTFKHSVSESAAETIKRFEMVKKACTQQGLKFEEEDVEQKLLD